MKTFYIRIFFLIKYLRCLVQHFNFSCTNHQNQRLSDRQSKLDYLLLLPDH